MDNTDKDGSDSDWDSTLDFTSPRQALGPGQFHPKIQIDNTEIEEESALSEESDVEAQQSLPIDNPVIKNVLKPTEDRPRSQSPNLSQRSQKENNIILAQKQQNTQAPQSDRKRKEPANQNLQNSRSETGPPYNFREAVQGSVTPEPAVRGPPGKDRKGTTYDMAPSPSPRGIPAKQSSLRSVGSWDESDADERTLRELRQKYRAEKQKEDLKKEAEEARSVAEDPPQTARSESTWKSWAGNKFGKKKDKQQQQQSQQQLQPQQQQQVYQQQQQQQVQQQQKLQQQSQQPVQTRSAVNTPRPDKVTVPMPVEPPRIQVTSPVMEVYDPRYHSPSLSLAQIPLEYQAKTDPRLTAMEEEQFEEPKQLFIKDENSGKYLYYFGHGHLRYYEVNEDYDEGVIPPLADKVDKISRRIWQESFAIIRILLSFFIAFLVEFVRFVSMHIFQPLILGVFVTLGDFIVKPMLSAIFNGIAQPFSIFLWNVFTGLRHMFRPLGDILRSMFEQLAMLFRSIRLFEVTWVTRGSTLPYQQGIQTV